MYNLEKFLNSDEYKISHPWIGSDIKIMGFRDNNEVSITMCVPLLCTFVNNVEEYISNKKQVEADIIKYIKTIRGMLLLKLPLMNF